MLRISSLSVNYGATPALQDIDLVVRQGEVACVVGQNGAGKSSLLSAVAGALPNQACQGQVEYQGKSILGRKAEDIARMGISLVPEGRHVFSDMTVKENLLIGTYMRRDRRNVKQEIETVLELFPRLRERLAFPAGLLSGGEQQMLVIGRSVLTNTKFMLIDEPSLGLAPLVIDNVYQALLALRNERGLTLLINEQSSNRVMKYADTIHVLRGGRKRLTTTVQEVGNGETLKAAYFGLTKTDETAAEVM
ncbi:ABC transporter ATP-binding protein [Eoetvoesia caeni]|nr:ABC transporter ATP-binding protein [Eoetvoesiella caeni]NYT56887.1 ABC transporter ATP-binding protein [Eoetvoesiella caeni]